MATKTTVKSTNGNGNHKKEEMEMKKIIAAAAARKAKKGNINTKEAKVVKKATKVEKTAKKATTKKVERVAKADTIKISNSVKAKAKSNAKKVMALNAMLGETKKEMPARKHEALLEKVGEAKAALMKAIGFQWKEWAAVRATAKETLA